MSKLLKRVKPDILIENKIVTAAIVSDLFLQDFIPLYNPMYLQNKYAQRVCNWCVDYFDMYKKAPMKHISDIFDIEKEEMDRAEIELIQSLLENVNVNYMESGINDRYILDEALNYFRKRELQILQENLAKLIEFNKIEKAEDLVLNYKKVTKEIIGWYNPFDTKHISDVFDDRNQGIFSFPGELGHLFGPIERDWFVAFLGAFKVGKTHWLQEVAFLALMERLKVAYFSLEMQRKGVNSRLYKRITAFVEGGEEIIYPIFDCKKNQKGDCERQERTTEFSLLDENDEKPDFSHQLLYRACTACKGKEDSEYEIETWFDAIRPKDFTFQNVKKRVNAFQKMYSRNMRVICHPRFKATISDLQRDLEFLEQAEGFIPDVIIVDYADIIKPERRMSSETSELDEIWKVLSAMASDRHCILFSASQGTRGSLSKKSMDSEDVAGWIGKLGHVDIFASINRTAAEKKAGVSRIGMLAHRHRDFNELDQCIILQNYNIGQTHLDSQINRG